MKISDFSLDNYRNLITALLSEGYNFVTFNEYCRGVDDDYFVVLRHDVDKLPQNALRMARIEHDLGVKSTYYFPSCCRFSVQRLPLQCRVPRLILVVVPLYGRFRLFRFTSS